MASQSDKLAQSLSVLKALQEQGTIAIHTENMSRTHRERLLKNGFIKKVMKGWYIATGPNEPAGESTSWYASFWGFCTDYLNKRFGEEWCLGPEQSLSIHTDNWVVPGQLLVRTPKGGNKPIVLLHGTSLLDIRLDIPEKSNLTVNNGVRIMQLPLALVNVSLGHFTARTIEMRVALAMLQDDSELLRLLLQGGHSQVAGRLAGAFRNIGRDSFADNIVETMRVAGFTIYEKDPFLDLQSIIILPKEIPPYVNRLRMAWERMRDPIIKHFPAPSGINRNTELYLKQVDDVYVTDAYHSLSIEGYRVSEELIERVRSGNWDPEKNVNDRNHQDALAARGYWQAFQEVKKSIAKVLGINNPGVVVQEAHHRWYLELFGPGVTAGIIDAANLAGYRNQPVFIRRSMHVPPNYEAVRNLMPAFFDLLSAEESAEVRCVMGHFMFVFIHPYVDGNGRMGRFLMNVMLAAGGYSWTVVPIESRNDYMAALEAASVEQDIIPFTKFLAGLINRRLS